jgi:putative CocE/NonD family hydrolase
MNNANVLSKTKPNGNNSSTYIYDPDNPVPTIGANISSLAGVNPLPQGTKNPIDVPTALRRYNIVNPGGYNQKEGEQFFGSNPPYSNLSERKDVLSFQSEQLTKDTEITGPIECILYVSSNRMDTDFTAKLIDVYPHNDSFPEGFAFNITDGILRMRYRDSFKQENFMTKDEIYKIKIILYPTSNIFKNGHKIRVDISSSNFPRFDFNPNTGEPIGLNTRQIKATNTVYFSNKYPSHIILPIIDR